MLNRTISLLLLCLLILGAPAAAGRAEGGAGEADWRYVLRPDGTAEVTRYFGEEEDLVIPAVLDGHPVTAVGLLELWTVYVTSVTIPEGVTEIGPFAFEECYDLEEVRLPSTLRSIGQSSFSLCGIRELTLPEGLLNIGREAFEGSDLETVLLPSTVRNITGNPFVRCGSLRAIDVSPDNPFFASVGGVLYDRAGERLICWPADLRRDRCEIPAGTRVIGREAFAYTDHPFEAVLPEGVTTLEYYAFAYCAGSEIWLPASLTEIDEWAFYGQGLEPMLHVVPGSFAEAFCAAHGLPFDTEPAD